MLDKKIIAALGMSLLVVPQCLMAQTVGTVNATALNVRSKATTSSSVVTKVYKGASLEVLDVVGGSDPWYKILIKGKNAYIKQEYLTLTKADGVSDGNSLNIRSYPSTESYSQVIGKLNRGDKVTVVYKVGNFYKIFVNGKPGFVASQYIDSIYSSYLPKQSIKNVRDIVTGKDYSSQATTTTKVTGEQIVQTAKKYLGNPYVYGGTSLTNGADCSGFTQSIMKLFNISIPRTAQAQSQQGKLISKNNMQKGDLIFFGNSTTTISHVGIYIGDGKMIHASTASTGIIISDAYTSGKAPLQVIRRVI